MSVKFPFFEGGFGGGGGECRFYFYGRADFSDIGRATERQTWSGSNSLGHWGVESPCRASAYRYTLSDLIFQVSQGIAL